MSYREDKQGQMLGRASTRPARCAHGGGRDSYTNHGVPMVPFYIFYSMFGFQRVGDFIWAAGDMRARGFLLGKRPAAPPRKACNIRTVTASCWRPPRELSRL
jgi:pyruvate dehydrogenase E1 component